MKPDTNVLHLSQVASKQSSAAPLARLPVALTQVRDMAAQQLKQSLQGLFDNADDTLFEMADRATSNTEQNVFFEAMRDFRLNRKGIEHGLLKSLLETFAMLNQYQIGKPALLDAVSFDSLSLVHNDALEESVAMDSMVSKVMSRDRLALGQLSTRFNVLISRKLDDKSNPLGPVMLCEFFRVACSGLGVEIKVKLIIFKLFEKYVLNDLDQLYAQANQLLVSAGVLPDLKSLPVRSSPSRAPLSGACARHENVAQSERGHDGQGVQEVFAVLQELLSQVRDTALAERRRPVDALPISSHDLLRLLSHLQQRLPVQEVAESDFDLRNQLEHLLLRASAKSGKARVVGEMDEDVINLVSMLFEFILDDRSLPDSLKALIARMQIPMLKVAVLDKTFFNRASHPARRLLNEIASAALGWSDQDHAQRDSLYQKIEYVVQRLRHDFVDDPGIFSELLADFLAFTGDERRRSDLLEQRTRDAEEGSAKAEQARRRVERALNERLLGKTLPQVVVRLLQEAWSQVLMLTCLKHGIESPEWSCALTTMDDLVWSVEPHEDPQARLSLLELVPGLLKSLRQGMTCAAFDPFATNEFFGQLEALHVQAFQRFKRSSPIDPAPADSRGQFGAAADAAAGVFVPIAEAASDAPPTMIEVVQRIVLLVPGQSQAPAPEINLADDDEALLAVDNLRVGSWVEFQEDAEHKLRCKLAALIKSTGKYIFVNRTGMKVLEKTRMGLALEFKHGAIRLLDDALLFDRALESVIGNLRRLKSA